MGFWHQKFQKGQPLLGRQIQNCAKTVHKLSSVNSDIIVRISVINELFFD